MKIVMEANVYPHLLINLFDSNVQVALDEAAFLLDLSSVEGTWDDSLERISECYREAGLPGVARFILYRDWVRTKEGLCIHLFLFISFSPLSVSNLIYTHIWLKFWMSFLLLNAKGNQNIRNVLEFWTFIYLKNSKLKDIGWYIGR